MVGNGSFGLSRREVCLLLPALAASAAGAAEVAALPGKVYLFETLPVRKNGENSFRPILQGTNHSGFPIELHETDLAPGSSPHPPHHHVHEELFMIREGTLEVTMEGKTSRIGAGSAAYVASNQEHGFRNPGPGHAQYFVFALGAQASS
ncbi:MAG: cupin domain-containing protein [Terriglobia bacterium]|jgi:mannose-6-phosphate isomerase-like protein (cupin superfamily)